MKTGSGIGQTAGNRENSHTNLEGPQSWTPINSLGFGKFQQFHNHDSYTMEANRLDLEAELSGKGEGGIPAVFQQLAGIQIA